MKSYNITLIPGDGIGPELTTATRRVLEATGVKLNWDIVHAGTDVMAEYGTPLPPHVDALCGGPRDTPRPRPRPSAREPRARGVAHCRPPAPHSGTHAP